MKKIYNLAILVFIITSFSACSISNNVSKSDNTRYLSDINGMTLYTFDKDKKNKSNCYNGCEVKWPVFYGDSSKLKLPNGFKQSDFGTIIRDNGAKQSTYKSMPLYYFFKDNKPKDKKGDGIKGVWHIIK